MKFILFILLLCLTLSGFGQEERFEPRGSATADLIEALKKSDGKLDINNITDPKILHLFKRSFAESPLHKMSREQVKLLIMLKVKGKPLEKLFNSFPKTLEIATDLLLSKEAFPALLNIVEREDDLKFVGVCGLLLLICGYFFSKKVAGNKLPLLRRVALRFGIQSFVTLSIIYVFYMTFKQDLDPALNVISQYF